MLKNIDPLLSGSLLAILDDMGHGDELVIADANFPAAALARRLLDMPGCTATDLARAVFSVVPLDDFVESPLIGMAAPDHRPAIFADFEALAKTAEGRDIGLEAIERHAFYERAKSAYAIIATGERRLYANLIVKKGVIRD